MSSSSYSNGLLLLTLFLLSATWITTTTASQSLQNKFLQCMYINSPTFNNTSITKIHTPNTSSYSSLLSSYLKTLRYESTRTPKPQFIVTPFSESEIRATVVCSRKNSLQIRVRSGGHDYEGLSSISAAPFVIVDLVNFRSITVDVKDGSAWVQAGATLGELYYRIAEKSKTLGFPAGNCPTVGVGGQFSGGGVGFLLRKYGVSSDNILDATLIDINGRTLNRNLMGENLFWAIRGGGGASFGVILSWKIKLVSVPPKVTVFSPQRTLGEGATKLVQKWQAISSQLHEDLFIRIVSNIVSDKKTGKKTVAASFNSMYLGSTQDLLKLMEKSFPELGLTATDCTEMSWIQSVVYFATYRMDQPSEILLNRTNSDPNFYKGKSDYIEKPIPKAGWEGLWERMLMENDVYVIIDPSGAKMGQISETEIAFPHRKGTLVQYLVKWKEGGSEASKKHTEWMNSLYKYMTPYVTSSPRAAYVNYKDLDLGKNEGANTTYLQASAWGYKYFKSNFRRLALVKRQFDPENYFRNEQSIPPL